MRFYGFDHQKTYIKVYNVNRRQEITGQTVETTRVGCAESSLTDTTKYIQQKEQKEYYTRSTISNWDKVIKEERLHKKKYRGK